MWQNGKGQIRATVLIVLVMAAILGLAGTGAAIGAAAGADIAWGSVPSPNGGNGPNELRAVAALSANDIWAVGSYGNFVNPEVQIQHWNGVAWNLVPEPAGLPRGELVGIAAVAADDIWAVGGAASTGASFIIHWDGNSWQSVSHPTPHTYQRLYGVAAVAADDVWAVGEFSQDGGVLNTLTMHWDGNEWRIVSSPSSNGHDGLNSVAAVAANDVWAVGHDGFGQVLTIHWDGQNWSQVPAPSGSTNAELSAVSAVSSDDVWAVGENRNGFLSLQWDGEEWQQRPIPTPLGFIHDLTALVAVSSDEVWAGGFYTAGSQRRTIALRWDGTRWLMTKSVSPDPTLNAFYGMGTAGGEIWAVGETAGGTLIEHWNGKGWSVVAGANAGVGENELMAISAVSSQNIWAVGNMEGNSLTMHWDGAGWTIVPSPNGQFGIPLHGVKAFDGNNVWAVGETGSSSGLQYSTVAMHWNGKTWSIVSTPNPGGDLVDRLYDVDGVAGNDVWAVGEYWDGNLNTRPLIIHWDGDTWRVGENNCDPFTGLRGVSVLAANDIWAVGDSAICRYDGKSWETVPSPQPRPQFREIAYPLYDVDGLPGGPAWAVGSRVISNGQFLVHNPLVEFWNGQSWTLFTNLPAGVALYGVEALAANNVWVVGTNSIGSVVLHWNGASWRDVPAPDPVNGGDLRGVTRDDTGVMWAAGYYLNEDYDARTLILEAPSTTQGSVVGDTNVAFATVSWFGPVNGSTTTNSFGEYDVAGLPAGDYSFIVSIQGCDPVLVNVNVIAGITITQDFNLTC